MKKIFTIAKKCGQHILCLLISATFATQASADNGVCSALNVKLYPTQDKISQSKISHFVQDGNGYIWFGTWDGLVRFDGRQTRLYKTYPGDSVHIENHRVMRLLLSKQGNIWVSTYGRHCYVFDTERNCFCNPLTEHGNIALQLYTLNNGAIWTFDGDSTFNRITEKGHSQWEVSKTTLPFCFEKVYNIKEDSLGNEWILTNVGAYIHNLGQSVGEEVYRFMVSQGNQTYLATRERLYRYDYATQELIDQQIHLPAEIEDMQLLSDGRILLSQRGHVSIFSPSLSGEGRSESQTYPFSAAILRYTFEDSHHRLWLLGNEDQVYLIEEDKLRTIPYHGQPVEATTAAFQFAFEDDYGTVWIQPGGSLPLSFYDDSNDRLEQAYTYENGRRRRLSFYIRSGAIDKQHNLWGNIDEVGFCYFAFSNKEFDFISEMGGRQSGMGARAMMLDSQHRLWVGWHRDNKSDEGGIALYDSLHHLLGYIAEDGRLLDSPKGSLQANIYTMHQDRKGRVWLGARTRGLYLLEPRNTEGTSFRVANYLPLPNRDDALAAHSVYDILEDHRGRIWVGTYGQGIDLVDDSQGFDHLRFIHTPGLTINESYIRTLCETSDHRLLAGHNNGLMVADLDSDSLVFFHNHCTQNPHSLASNSVMNITELRDGRIAVSTFGGGVNILPAHFELSDTLHFEHHDTRHGDVPDVVLATLQSTQGDIWVMSENSLRKYTPDFQLQSTFLQGTPCSEAIPVADTLRHHLYLASKNDMLCFLYHNRQHSSFQPPVVFTDLSIHRNDMMSVIQNLTPADTLITLAADDRNFTLQCIALDYAGQSDIQYMYRIDGPKGKWIPLQKSPAIHFVDIPAGQYELEVRSTNADGQWCELPARLTLVIEPYFYETLWFRALLWALLIGALGYSCLYIFRRIDRRRKARMENQLAEAKVKFYTEATQQKNPENEIFIQQLIALVQEHMLNEDFTVEQCAALMNMSYPVFYKRVKSAMDLSPVELVRQMRIQKAQQLLKEKPGLSVAEIAYACGFSTPQYFNRVFKEQTGYTPAEYRRSQPE